MNWPFVLRGFIAGLLTGIWQIASSIYVLSAWPDPFTWLKIGSAAAGAFVGGIALYAMDPEAAWKRLSGAVIKCFPLLLVLALLTGCIGPQFGGMNATETIEMMKAQNSRGCIYVRGSATPWAAAGFMLVGTWGELPPSYGECFEKLPLLP